MMYNKDTIYQKGWNKFKKSLQDIPTSKVIKTNKVDTLTNISYMEFGSSELWWLIAEYNKMPPKQTLEVGTELKIPTLKSINTLIKRTVPELTNHERNDRGL